MIYIVVDVTYDYYRFQENVFASNSINECLEWIKTNKNSFKSDYKTLEYKKDSQEMKDLDHRESCHFWIEPFGPDPTLVKNVGKLLDITQELFNNNQSGINNKN